MSLRAAAPVRRRVMASRRRGKPPVNNRASSEAPPRPDEDGEPKPRECVVLSGGISNDATHAVAGSYSWHKSRKEKLGDFIERAKQAARAKGERSVIIRGVKW